MVIGFSREVKEEIVDDDATLPSFNGKVISWVNLNFLYESIGYKFRMIETLNIDFSWCRQKGAMCLILIRNALIALHRQKFDVP